MESKCGRTVTEQLSRLLHIKTLLHFYQSFVYSKFILTPREKKNPTQKKKQIGMMYNINSKPHFSSTAICLVMQPAMSSSCQVLSITTATHHRTLLFHFRTNLPLLNT